MRGFSPLVPRYFLWREMEGGRKGGGGETMKKRANYRLLEVCLHALVRSLHRALNTSSGSRARPPTYVDSDDTVQLLSLFSRVILLRNIIYMIHETIPPLARVLLRGKFAPQRIVVFSDTPVGNNCGLSEYLMVHLNHQH